MSGYLDVKVASRRAAPRSLVLTRALTKAWKKQWCILRPNPTKENSGAIALHSSRGLAANSTIDLPPGATVSRTKSRTHQFAFGIFLDGDYRRPHVLLAGQTESETQMWMSRIRALLNGKNTFGRDILLKNSYDVSVIDNDFSRKCLLYGVHGTLTISSHGLLISRPDQSQHKTFIAWKHFSEINLTGSDNAPDKNKICIITTNSLFAGGAGDLTIFSPKAPELVRAVKEGRSHCGLVVGKDWEKRISRSEGDLYNWSCDSSRDDENVGVRRSSWYSGPSEVSLDDTDLIMSKDASLMPPGQLLRCTAADDLYPITYNKHDLVGYVHKFSQALAQSSDRRSCASVASGIYEEILEDVDPKRSENHDQNKENAASVDPTRLEFGSDTQFVENTYESVAECIHATMRRTGKRYQPPPLPPRSLKTMAALTSSTKLNEDWSRPTGTDAVDGNVTRHSSLGSIPSSCSGTTSKSKHYLSGTKTLPKQDKQKPTFNVFRKRIKSDSRVVAKPESTRLEDKTVIEPKKKRFDFNSPSKLDIIRNFRVSRVLMRNLKISRKIGEAKSCEYLDTDVDIPDVEKRCSKSVETLDNSCVDFQEKEEGQDLSVIYSDNDELSLPHDIVELILRGRDDLAVLQLRQREMSESDYVPMSPNGVMVLPSSPATEEQHYMVMRSAAPRVDCAASAPDIVT